MPFRRRACADAIGLGQDDLIHHSVLIKLLHQRPVAGFKPVPGIDEQAEPPQRRPAFQIVVDQPGPVADFFF